ncbi:UbiA family prenyltransferase [Aurantimonas sp. C2-6-R+9]|uniref:UbiA family prenyltransferase n=1 Tax=unclassified Aurantimonas TaxID=2638230 RepID=UPI002E19A3A7|nr:MULTISPECIES: UbiA family prenyltransferase [unclassified Aurantimonas]MEC5292274.1 UbiA family prenyltransferase [Aurantimonas sp. C2-3-R2]MEC5382489.1 UbiA family prenyltransferase [Aurantimonas sp. C2-6-R+9]MEC5413359.1 UbiA family prenyltransferase [Aurantimonas sp. C2-4-R8]
MTATTILRLGRVSNLPTVWTNALAGAVLAGGAGTAQLLTAMLALSLFYVGGMWLNDAFDAEIDAGERAGRPIPQGEISRRTVFQVGFTLLAAGILASLFIGPTAALVGVALAGAVVLYDWLHKRTILSPVLMGATRFLAYALGAAAAGSFPAAALVGALGLSAYVVGLTYAAKQEAYNRIDRAWPLGVLAAPLLYSLWLAGLSPLALVLWLALAGVVVVALRLLFRRARGDVPRGVVTLIAGISLYDAVLIAAAGEAGLALAAAAGFLMTLALQRLAPGT